MYARQVLNISLPNSLAFQVKQAVKKEGYASTSEFFRYLLHLWLEDKALAELNKSRKEIASGKGRVLTSLKDLRYNEQCGSKTPTFVLYYKASATKSDKDSFCK